MISKHHFSRLQSLNEALSSGDKENAKQAYLNEVKDLNDQLEAEKQKDLEAATSKSSGDGTRKGGQPWSEAEIQTLIKGVNVFPAGTKER